ncbi:MAG: hypothetical protein SPE36_04780 [Lactobacillus johnsonii]|nr:hypothetical protein [Lactobacillus johnsonii]
MKGITKFICIGLGAAAVGFIAYELLKKDGQITINAPKEDSSITNDLYKSDDHTQEIIERRRKRLAQKIEEQRDAKSEIKSANNDSEQSKPETEIVDNTKSE